MIKTRSFYRYYESTANPKERDQLISVLCNQQYHRYVIKYFTNGNSVNIETFEVHMKLND